jgi:hypothetical protein
MSKKNDKLCAADLPAAFRSACRKTVTQQAATPPAQSLSLHRIPGRLL